MSAAQQLIAYFEGDPKRVIEFLRGEVYLIAEGIAGAIQQRTQRREEVLRHLFGDDWQAKWSEVQS